MTNVKDWRSSKTELLGYVPLNKRIAQLQISGIRTMLARDALYDDLVGRDDDIPVPVLPRHLQADMAEASEAYRYYKARRKELEAKLRQTMVKPQAEPEVVPPFGGCRGCRGIAAGGGHPAPELKALTPSW